MGQENIFVYRIFDILNYDKFVIDIYSAFHQLSFDIRMSVLACKIKKLWNVEVIMLLILYSENSRNRDYIS